MMTRPRTWLGNALSAMLVAGFAGIPLGFAFGAEPAVLRGNVKNKEGFPLPGVRIRAAVPATDMRQIDPDAKLTILETKSDAKGEYRLEIPGLTKPTKVSLDAMIPGYARLVGTLMGGGDARNVEVTPGGAAAEANLALTPARYFAGVVVDAKGEPIAGVQVIASIASKSATAYVEVLHTDKDGGFEVFGYPVDAVDFGDGDAKDVIEFSHPSHLNYRLNDLGVIDAKQRGEIRVVMPTGYTVTGRVLDVAGKPVANAMVEAEVKTGVVQRKAVVTDAEGKFALRGLIGGPTTVTAQSFAIKQKARVPLNLDDDQTSLDVRLKPIVMPAGLKTTTVLGMQVADASAGLKEVYDLYQDRGVVILDAGPDSKRLGIGEIAEGFTFWMVGEARVGNVREFVNQILKETGGRDDEKFSVRVVYNFKTAEMVGSNTQYLELTRDDVKELRVLAGRLNAEGR